MCRWLFTFGMNDYSRRATIHASTTMEIAHICACYQIQLRDIHVRLNKLNSLNGTKKIIFFFKLPLHNL